MFDYKITLTFRHNVKLDSLKLWNLLRTRLFFKRLKIEEFSVNEVKEEKDEVKKK